MPHAPGPYVKHPQRDGFRISTAGNMHLADVPPLGFAARNKVSRGMIEATANLFAASPVMFLALQTIVLDTSIDVSLRDVAQHAIDLATNGPANAD